MISDTGVMSAENSALNHKNKLQYQNKQKLFFIVVIFYYISVCGHNLWSEWTFLKTFKIINLKLLNGSVGLQKRTVLKNM